MDSARSIVLSGLFAAVVSSSSSAVAADHPFTMSEVKPHVPNIPADVPATPNNFPIRRANILDVMDKPVNRKQRRQGVTLG